MPRYALMFFMPGTPLKKTESLCAVVLKTDDPTKINFDNFQFLVASLATQLLKMPRFMGCILSRHQIIPVLPQDDATEEALQKFIESTPPEILQLFMVTL